MEKLKHQYHFINREFTKQAKYWKREIPHMLLDLTDRLKLQAHQQVLDVAAGSGLVSMAMAPKVKSVCALDLTDAMLDQGQRMSDQLKINNIKFVKGFAEKLPFENEQFDWVVTRYSFHHFIEPSLVLKEMRRVCKRQGKIVVMDLVSPESEATGNLYNHLERLRDPTHTQALPLSRLRSLFKQLDLKIEDLWQIQHPMDLDEWLDFSETGPDARHEIYIAIDSEISGKGKATGFAPWQEKGRTMFHHHIATIVASKCS